MLKQIVKTILLSLLILLVIPVFCYGFSVDLQLSTGYAQAGDNIAISGQADANSWISTKVLDEGQSIIYFNAVKSNGSGVYNDNFVIPDNTEGCLTVVAGAGANVASQTLLVGTLSTQVSLELSVDEAVVGDIITASGSADPDSWVAIKAVDQEGSILFFDAVKAGEGGTFSKELVIPEMAAGCLEIIAGYGENTDSQTLLVGTLSTQVSLELSAGEAVAGDIITASGRADPDSWVAIKAVDQEGSILFFDAVKADIGGDFSKELVIPEMAAGSLEIIAGYGDNTASQTLIIGTLSTQVSLELSADEAVVGDSIEAYGTADPGSWVTIKAVDNEGAILFFDAVKADANGSYTMDLIIPEVTVGDLSIIAGYGDNTASQNLAIGTLSTQVTLDLSDYEGVAGESITASGTADPNTWVAIKAVDEQGAILFFDAVKADASGEYSISLVIPEVAEGKLNIIAGYGDNTATRILTIKGEVDECFIATAAFGSKYQPSVALLRAFRDKYLLSNSLGQALVKIYYQSSPPIANYIAGSEPLKCLVRIMLTPFIAVAYLLFHPLWMCLILGLGLTLVVLQQRKKAGPLKSI